MIDARRYSKEEKDQLAKDGMLWVCQECGYECDCDMVGEICPHCRAVIEDTTP